MDPNKPSQQPTGGGQPWTPPTSGGDDTDQSDQPVTDTPAPTPTPTQVPETPVPPAEEPVPPSTEDEGEDETPQGGGTGQSDPAV